VLDKWKRAVIHLECATDSEHFYDRIKRINQQRAQLEQGQISHEQFAEELAGRSRDIRFHGTALLLAHGGRRYLLTARHVVWDETSAKRELEEEAQRALSWPEHMRQHLLQSAVERAQNNIFNIIFRVPSIDEVIADTQPHDRAFLMNLGAGASFTVPYTFSDPELDLALISLDQRDSRFADELQRLGFIPVSSEDVADGPEGEGQDVFTVGFPSSTAIIGQVSQHPASAHWSSSHFSVPVSSFGKVSMLHEGLPFFWVDMSIFPGNSGGPLIEKDRLVGVVSAQATVPIDDVPNVRTRIPFGRIIKSKFVHTLLEMQEKKDRR
jgi:hypothetical protein